MYIEPNTNIRLLKNVPLDTTYQHTILFTSASAQASYFQGKQKYNLTGYSYQRVQRGRSRVGIVADNIYDCNYMMFQNTNFGSKWFYAFITGIEYINNACSEITFEIDVMQTWMMDYTLEPCFVEREHSVTDEIGDNIIPENVDTGEYVFNDVGTGNGNAYAELTGGTDVDMTAQTVIIAIVDVKDKKAVDGKNYDGVYGGCTLYAYSVNEETAINEKLKDYLSTTDAIVSMYLIPNFALPSGIPSDNLVTSNTKGASVTVTKNAVSKGLTIDGYTPKNAKLYTYPFNYFHVDNASGDSLQIRYEFCDDLMPKFEINGVITQPVSVLLRPIGYKGAVYPKTETLSLGNYPLCSWNSDSYQAWVAQNSIPLGLKGVGLFGMMGAMAMTGNVVGTALTGLNAITSYLSEGYKASITADICKGSVQNGNINVAHVDQSFYGGRCSITADYAKSIDNFFNVYGYATKKVKTPNRDSRPHWNYVKTVDCNVYGSVPADDMRKICGIYDKGITFWKNGSEVGNYTLDNSV